MTFAEFVVAAKAAGVRDDDVIGYVDWNGQPADEDPEQERPPRLEVLVDELPRRIAIT